MPHWWNETITIYRKQKTKGADGKTSVDWNREVLSGCFVGTYTPTDIRRKRNPFYR